MPEQQLPANQHNHDTFWFRVIIESNFAPEEYDRLYVHTTRMPPVAGQPEWLAAERDTEPTPWIREDRPRECWGPTRIDTDGSETKLIGRDDGIGLFAEPYRDAEG